ncbi:MAG: phosphate ABC transporter permease subunit PstC [Archaeoglobaceae archaeon]|uniref:Phosphate transport system permease protein n=1 Tax=Archaeoglobus fulgidus TaxID=2234 RepID=A0A7J3M459_ARCFL
MDRFKLLLLPVCGTVLGILMLMLLVFAVNSAETLARQGIETFTSNVWIASEIPEEEFYGLLAAIYGTLYTSILALILALPTSIALAVFTIDFVPQKAKEALVIPVDIMAGLPTVLYGLWGLFVLAPLVGNFAPIFYEKLSFVPLFSYYNFTGFSYLTASILLAIMVTPFATAIIREAYRTIPATYREAVYSLGLTRYEATKVLLSFIKPSILAGSLLAFGRAVGETVAVSLVVGNTFNIHPSFFAPGYTISSLLANQFGNAFVYRYMPSALFCAGLVLFLIGLLVNIAGVLLLRRWRHV